VSFVRDDIAKGTIGPEGGKYAPYLLAMFLFILVGNLFELTPFINFPITSRMAIPLMLSVFTYLFFVIVGFSHNGLAYLGQIIWPRSVRRAGLVGDRIRLDLRLRPITLAQCGCLRTWSPTSHADAASRLDGSFASVERSGACRYRPSWFLSAC
jgi:hypothetical protein